MILPVMGIVSEVIPVFSRKPIFGYTAIVFSTVAIGFYSMLVWAHHMFSVGLSTPLLGFFMISSMMIAVPTGVKILNWIATTWRGNLIFETPMLFALGFVGAVHDRRPLRDLPRRRPDRLAGRPTRTSSSPTCTTSSSAARCSGSSRGSTTGGRRSSAEFSTSGSGSCTSGSCSSASTSRSSRSTCSVSPGCRGGSTRTETSGSWEAYNLISTIGAFVMAVGMIVFVANVHQDEEASREPASGNDPWLGDTLEWYTTSPPPLAQFRQGSVRDEREAIARPATPDLGAARMRPGPWLRLTALAGAAGNATCRRFRLGRTSGPATACSPRLLCRRSPRSPPPPGSAIGGCCRPRSPLSSCSASPQRSRRRASTSPWPPWLSQPHSSPQPSRGAERLRLCNRLLLSLRESIRDYVTLTKPRIMTLLLLTGFCGMVVGAGGLPSLWLGAATMAGLALACGGASALNHVLDADIDRLMGKRTRSRPVAAGPSARAVRARVRARPLRALVRAAGRVRQRPDRCARPRRQPLLRPRLHAPPEALDAAEHRHRRSRRRRAAARRLGGGDRRT